jgi:chromosome segregation ATPase
MFSFIRNLVGVKTDQAVQGAVEALVRWDPKSATEAELRTMEQHLDELGRQVAEARASYTKEKKEADAIKALSSQRMAAAEQLQRQMDAETDPARKASFEKSLATIVNMLEQMAPDVDREVQDEVDAHEFLTMLEDSYNQAGAKLKDAKSALERAQRDMGRAEQQREMAARQAEAARQAAGLAGATSGLNVALKAMQDSAAKNLVEAEAAKTKAKMLAPTKPEQDDPNIAAALAAASGKAPAASSLSDRLAALRSKQ